MAECIVQLGCPPDKVKIQHLGVEVDQIVFKPRIWQTGEPLRILIAAAFREKRYLLRTRVIRTIAERSGPRNCYYWR